MAAGFVWRKEAHVNGQVGARRAPSGGGRSGRRLGASHPFVACAWDDGVAQVRLSLDVDRIFLFLSPRIPSTSATTLLTRTCASIGSMTRLAHAIVTSLPFEKKLPKSPPPSPVGEETPRSVPDVFDRVYPGSSHVARRRGRGTYGTWRWWMACHGKVERRHQAWR